VGLCIESRVLVSFVDLFLLLHTSLFASTYISFCFYIHLFLLLHASLFVGLCIESRVLVSFDFDTSFLNLSFVSRSLLISASIFVGLFCGFLLGALL